MDTIIEEKALENRGLKNQFSYYLGETFGSISFGKIDDRYVDNTEDDIGWT